MVVDSAQGPILASDLDPRAASARDVADVLADKELTEALEAAERPPQTTIKSTFSFAPPVLSPSKIIGVGLNYHRHARESGAEPPARPVLFAKWPNSLRGSGEPIPAHRDTSALDYEGELAVVISRVAKRVPRERALEVVGGFCCANDVTARDLQRGPGGQWVRSKSLDGFCPIGPWVATPKEVGDWRQLRIRTWVNGELRQDELCGDMIFGVEALIEEITTSITLVPGDLILTGTPAGVGMGFSPPRWLAPGDLVDVEISGIGKLSSRVAPAE